MKLYTWLPLLLTASASAKDAVCSNSLYGALAPLAQVPEAQGFCNSKFPPPKKRVAPSTTSTTSTTSSTTKSTTKSTTVSTTKSSTTKSTTLQASTTFKPSTTTKLGDKLSSLSALASDVAKTFCSCYFSAATTTVRSDGHQIATCLSNRAYRLPNILHAALHRALASAALRHQPQRLRLHLRPRQQRQQRQHQAHLPFIQ